MATLHAHLDESGDFRFTPTGTRYYVFSLAWTYDPAPLARALTMLRFRLLKRGENLSSFHATEDRQVVRNEVISLLTERDEWRFAGLVVDKRKVNPAIRKPEDFYPKFAAMLLRFLLKGFLHPDTNQVQIFTDSLPIKRNRESVEKTIKTVCRATLNSGVAFHLFHHPRASNTWLQVADYCSWALFRKWERGDHCYYDQLRARLAKRELDVLARGLTLYY